MQNSITCPHCQQIFKLDETGYADIVKQIKDDILEKEIKKRLILADKEKENAIKLTEAKLKTNFQEIINKKEKELTELKTKAENELLQQLSKKELEIIEMQAQIKNTETAKQLAIQSATQEIEKKCLKLQNNLDTKELEKQNLENTLKQQHLNEIKAKDEIIKYKDEEVARLKDMKAKLSIKMLGETLEKHCENEFNKLRAVGFQNAYFEKDNKVTDGTKGDYIYKEMDEDGNEIISIMFEMKNESDTTSSKKKNEDFFAKLDKDRNAKQCEYAVLISLLEADSEYYNNGIVDVSYRFNKMYVIRPQFFIPLITLLKNAALNSLKYKKELNVIRNQHIDITNFEEKINKFKDGFARNYDLASRQFQTAIDEIDKTIIHLQKTKDSLVSSINNLRLANNKADELTIKKLTYNNPTMKQKFKDLKNNHNN